MKKLNNAEWKDLSYVLPAKIIPSEFQWIVVNYTKLYHRDQRGAPDKDQINDLVKNLKQFSKRCGLRLEDPKVIVANENCNDREDLDNAFIDYVNDFPNLKIHSVYHT